MPGFKNVYVAFMAIFKEEVTQQKVYIPIKDIAGVYIDTRSHVWVDVSAGGEAFSLQAAHKEITIVSILKEHGIDVPWEDGVRPKVLKPLAVFAHTYPVTERPSDGAKIIEVV